ncbi:hypothetical protein ACLOJK_032786 [Asimina triloba]
MANSIEYDGKTICKAVWLEGLDIQPKGLIEESASLRARCGILGLAKAEVEGSSPSFRSWLRRLVVTSEVRCFLCLSGNKDFCEERGLIYSMAGLRTLTIQLIELTSGYSDSIGSSDLLTDILKKHGAEGKEELGQAQFAQLLQLVLQDLADVLAEKHVVFIYDLKITNGSKLRKILDNEKLLNAMIEKMMESNHSDPDGRWKIENILGFLEKKGPELGLPSREGNEPATLLYDQVFTDVKKGKNDVELGRENFAAVVKDILEKFSAQLEANPIFS